MATELSNIMFKVGQDIHNIRSTTVCMVASYMSVNYRLQ